MARLIHARELACVGRWTQGQAMPSVFLVPMLRHRERRVDGRMLGHVFRQLRPIQISFRTSVIPTLCCQVDRRYEFSTNAKYSGSGMRARRINESSGVRKVVPGWGIWGQFGECLGARTLQIPHAAVHSSLVADT